MIKFVTETDLDMQSSVVIYSYSSFDLNCFGKICFTKFQIFCSKYNLILRLILNGNAQFFCFCLDVSLFGKMVSKNQYFLLKVKLQNVNLRLQKSMVMFTFYAFDWR